MSAKPPVIAGLQLSNKPLVPAPGPEEKKDISIPKLPNGAILLDILTLNVVHSVTIIKHSDPSQYFPFLASCKCGSQGRTKSEVEIRAYAQYHLDAHKNDVIL